MTTRRRAAVNVIIPNRIYQRGQIFTWTHDKKLRCFEELKLKAVVNFWPKVDPDLADMGLDWYWQISCPRSEQMLEPRVLQAAEAIADYLLMPKQGNNVLVLCEAGKTRSVFFCIQLVRLFNEMSMDEAHAFVKKQIPSISLKGFMIDWMEKWDDH